LSKTDEVTPDVVKKITAEFKKAKKIVTPISIMDDESLTEVKRKLNELIKEKTATV
jgi:hypothetical protein